MRFEDLLNFRREKVDLATVKFTPELLAQVPKPVALRYANFTATGFSGRESLTEERSPAFHKRMEKRRFGKFSRACSGASRLAQSQC
jgi:hypothetical protein